MSLTRVLFDIASNKLAALQPIEIQYRVPQVIK